MGRVTYWVAYEYTYKLLTEDGWEDCSDFDAGRFHCPKKNIKKEVEKRVKEELVFDTIKDLAITISDSYLTTECEV